MSKQLSNIDIQRENGVLQSVTLVTPIWHKDLADETIEVTLPFFNLKTTAFSEEDIETAINEILEVFCKMCEKLGRGLEKELKLMGFDFTVGKEGQDNVSMGRASKTRDFALLQLIKTGDMIASKIEMNAVAA